jgi:hypothetical protein
MDPDTYPEGDQQGYSIFSSKPDRSIFSTTGSALAYKYKRACPVV